MKKTCGLPLMLVLLATPLALATPATAEMHQKPAVAGDMAPVASADMFKPYVAAEVKAAIESGKPVVLHFHKEGCPTCAAQQPTLQSFLHDHGDVMAWRVNFGMDKAANEMYAVRMQSTLVLFHEGKEIARSTGETDPAKLKELLGQIVG